MKSDSSIDYCEANQTCAAATRCSDPDACTDGQTDKNSLCTKNDDAYTKEFCEVGQTCTISSEK